MNTMHFRWCQSRFSSVEKSTRVSPPHVTARQLKFQGWSEAMALHEMQLDRGARVGRAQPLHTHRVSHRGRILRSSALGASAYRQSLARPIVNPCQPRGCLTPSSGTIELTLSPRQMFMRHNETCNIWTHLVGLAIFIAITISMAYDWGRYRLPRLPDTWTFGECILILLVWAILLTPGFFLTQRG